MNNDVREDAELIEAVDANEQDVVEQADEIVSAGEFSFAFAKRHQVLLEREEERTAIYYSDATELAGLMEARRFVGHDAQLIKLSSDDFERDLTIKYQHDTSQTQQLVEDLGNDVDLFTLADELTETQDLLESEDDAPIIKLINATLSEAIKEGASDVHIETFEKQLTIRFRVDGILREVLKPNRKLASLLVSRIKVMARLDIAEKRVPQDGRISLRIAGRGVDVRVSTMPSSHGERVVLRLLDKNQARLNLKDLGMTESVRERFNHLIHRPHGIILVTGPTGSGKSTTLYAGLTDLNSKDRNILTVEDPIEYNIDGIGQTQVNAKVDMTFARGLRAILRQDPDVVMIGEIRDLETAQIAVQASLTGHLVMSTLHTNTAVGAVTRLQDMGVETFLLSSSLLGVLAQRLVRTLCEDCREEHHADEAELALLGKSEPTIIYRPKGCESCNYTGYKGRTGIHELLEVDDVVREMIHNGASESEIERQARTVSAGIRGDGVSKVLAGITTLEEVLRVTREE
ncbi:type II secretion system ATPase GspE [Psychrobium sp. MM17-31]|uniref:type II secretion system ATPase GspE n=1 Tax=Psychrobium sp. MM17-31 TaxID=2917758 RepID=UPI001EF5A2AE|nr:type II secretion system ATPase GspE [Psychrobium sp. MM17-31]MCG7532196.1 type II secretion system ATPase GspE [Psychrobium sp. MM17-31]